MATLGKTAVGATFSSWPTGYVEVAGPYVASASGAITAVNLYVAGNATDANPVRGEVYADSAGAPGALVATGAAVTVNAGQAAGWISSAVSSASIVNGSSYWFGFMPGGGPNGCSFYKDTVAGASRYVSGVTYPTAPDPFGSPSTFTDQLSAYIDFTPAASASPPPPLISATAAVQRASTWAKKLERTWARRPNGILVPEIAWAN